MLDFFGKIIDFFDFFFSFVSSMIQSLITALSVLVSATPLAQFFAGQMFPVLSAAIMISMAFAIVKFVIGR